MAFFDWNHDGKKDLVDDFIEYQIYKKSMEQDKSHMPKTRKGMSTFGTILCMVAGLLGQCFLYMLLGIDVEDVPVIVMIILWVFFSAIAAVIVDKMG